MMRATNSVDITRHRAVLDKLTTMKVLSCPGEFPTSLDSASNQQWDYPNAWAPMQWFVVAAWVDIGDPVLEEAAEGVATRWLRSTYEVWRLYNQSMFEKVRINDNRYIAGYKIKLIYTLCMYIPSLRIKLGSQ